MDIAAIPSFTLRFLFLIIGVFVAYIFAQPLANVFKLGKWSLFDLHQSESGLTTKIFRVGVFYAIIGGFTTLANFGLVRLLDGPVDSVRATILISLLLVALGRALGANHTTNALMEELYLLSVGVIGVLVYLVLISFLPDEKSQFLSSLVNLLRDNVELLVFYGIGVIVVTLCGEAIWWIMRYLQSRKLIYERKIDYNIFREYNESQENYDYASNRVELVNFLTRVIQDCRLEHGKITDIYWKTTSGEAEVAEAILHAIIVQLQPPLPYEDMDERDQKVWREKGKDALRKMYDNGKGTVRIIMPLTYADAARDRIEEILGIKPDTVTDMGVKRFLVVNKRFATIGFPMPPLDPHMLSNKNESIRSNFAIKTRDPVRISECIWEFDALWNVRTQRP